MISPNSCFGVQGKSPVKRKMAGVKRLKSSVKLVSSINDPNTLMNKQLSINSYTFNNYTNNNYTLLLYLY